MIAPASQNPKSRQRILSALLSARAVVGTALTIGFYFIGATYYSAYLGQFHLDSQLFPRDTARHFVMGGVAVFTFCANALESLKNHPFQAVLWALGVALYFRCLAWFLATTRDDLPSTEKVTKLLSHLAAQWNTKHWFRRTATWVLFSALGLYVVVASLLAIIFIIGLPAIVGELAARLDYDNAIKAYTAGCKPSGRAVCFRLEQDNKPAVEGFLIATSSEQIALYNNGTVSVLPLKGNRLISVSPGTKP